MPNVNKSTLVSYTQEQMFELVNDVKAYSQFIPWCVGSEIINQTPDEIHAALTFSAGGMSKSFSTINRLQPHKMIEIRLLEGPFSHLEGFWRFEAMDDQCQIELDLEFEFSNKLLAMMFGPVFHQVATTLVDAFQKRAEDIYGKKIG